MKQVLLLIAVFGLAITMSSAQVTNHNTCGGFFYDSGGQTGDYSNNESSGTLICADGSGGSHISLLLFPTNLSAGDILCFYDGNDASANLIFCSNTYFGSTELIIQASAANTGGCLYADFISNSTDVSEGWIAKISCVASCQQVMAEITNASPIINPVDTGYIDICPGQRISLDGRGVYPQSGLVYNQNDATSKITWSFGDGTRAFGNKVAHTYTEPGGYYINLIVEDVMGCTSTTILKQRVRVSGIPNISVQGIPLEMCAKDSVFLTSDVVLTNNPNIGLQEESFSFPTGKVISDTLFLPDGSGATYSTSLLFTEFGSSATMTNLSDLKSLCLDLEHSYSGDLDIFIECPNGQEVFLLRGGSLQSANFGEPMADADIDQLSSDVTPGIPYSYCFTEDNPDYGALVNVAQSTYTYTTVPDQNGDRHSYTDQFFPAGSYLPEESFSGFVGCPLNGTWTITVRDNLGQDNGWIFEWGINFEESLFPNVEEFSPSIKQFDWADHPDFIVDNTSEIYASPLDAGFAKYILEIEDSFGCVFDTNVVIPVLPFVDPDCYTCDEALSVDLDTSLCEGEMVEFSNPELEGELVKFNTYPDSDFGFRTSPPNNPLVSKNLIQSINPVVLVDAGQIISEICVDIETNVSSDITALIKSPSGEQMLLFRSVGGFDANFTNTCFSFSSVTPIQTASAPFSGSFRPMGNWADLNGASINGEWELVVSDAFGPQDIGTIKSWSISFNFEYDWSSSWSGANLSCTNCPNPIYTHNSNSTLNIELENQLGCEITDQVSIGTKPDFDAVDLNCSRGNNQNVIISWTEPTGTEEVEIKYFDSQNNLIDWNAVANNELVFTDLAMGDSIVFYARATPSDDGSFCTSMVDTIICRSTMCAPDIMVVTMIPTCGMSNGSIQIIVNNGMGTRIVTWEDGMVATMRTGLEAGSYIIHALDDMGCDSLFTIDLFDASNLIIDSLTAVDVSCPGLRDGQATAFFRGGTAPFTLLWNNVVSSTSAQITRESGGVYTFTITDATGCVAIDSIEIMEPDTFDLNIIVVDNVCFGDNFGSIDITVTGGTPGYTYSWTGPNGFVSTMEDITNLFSGSYSLDITDANNCMINRNYDVIEPISGLAVSVFQIDTSCVGLNNSSLGSVIMGGTMPYTSSWMGGPNTPIWNNVADGWRFLSTTDANNCTSLDSILVVSYDSINAEINFVSPTCFGNADGILTVSQVTGGNGNGDLANYTYLWDYNANTTTIISDATGGRIYNLTITDAQGCQGEASRFLPLGDTLDLQLMIEDIRCYGDSNGVISITNVGNAVLPVTYLWSNAETTPSIMNLGGGTYSVTVEDANGCMIDTTYTMDTLSQILVLSNPVRPKCNETFGSVDIEVFRGVAPYTVIWEDGNTDFVRDSLIRGTYNITVTDFNGCTFERPIFIYSEAVMDSLIILVDSVDCFNTLTGSLRINPVGGTSPYQYSIDGGRTFGPFMFYPEIPAGQYDIVVRDADGCEARDVVTLDNPPELQMLNVTDTTMFFGDTLLFIPIVVGAQGQYTLIWDSDTISTGISVSTDNGSALFYPIQNNTYAITVIDEKGCEAEIFFRIRVDKTPIVFVPTGFTPGSRNNNRLGVLGEEGVFVEEFRVFDRWGELMYEEIDVLVDNGLSGWNGEFNGDKCQPGVYAWYAIFIYTDGETYQQSGHTILIR